MPASAATSERSSLIGDVTAVLLLILGLLLPWNVHFGLGVDATAGWVYAVLVTVTLLSSAMPVVGAAGRGRTADPVRLARLRFALSVPYLALVVAFLLFTVVVSVRYGGTGIVPPGIGPGAWFGVAGALLAARADAAAGVRAVRVIGWVSIVLAVSATLFNLYFRTRFVVPEIRGDVAVPNLVTALAAVLYGVVALVPVLIVGRWIVSGRPERQLATVLLGGSALLAGAVVWLLPVGRELDGFHGIAQSTGTAGVGYEGYLAWVAVAAIVGVGAVRAAFSATEPDLFRKATRSGLVLIAVWCGGAAVLRVIDVVLAAVLSLPAPPYNSTALMAFDLTTAVLAVWLFVNSANRAAPRTVTGLLLGTLFALLVSRLVLGIALVPQVQSLNPHAVNAVFGNQLSQQITSTFDVTLAVLALVLVAAALRPVRPVRTAPKARSTRSIPRTAVGASQSVRIAQPAGAHQVRVAHPGD